MNKDPQKSKCKCPLITVCDACDHEQCWNGKFMCENATKAGTRKLKRCLTGDRYPCPPQPQKQLSECCGAEIENFYSGFDKTGEKILSKHGFCPICNAHYFAGKPKEPQSSPCKDKSNCGSFCYGKCISNKTLAGSEEWWSPLLEKMCKELNLNIEQAKEFFQTDLEAFIVLLLDAQKNSRGTPESPKPSRRKEEKKCKYCGSPEAIDVGGWYDCTRCKLPGVEDNESDSNLSILSSSKKSEVSQLTEEDRELKEDCKKFLQRWEPDEIAFEVLYGWISGLLKQKDREAEERVKEVKIEFLEKDELYTNFYQCKSCEYRNIPDGAKYCGNCGGKISNPKPLKD